MTLTRVSQLIGASLALLGVILGAFAAHFLKPRLLLTPDGWDVWHTGIYYQWFHALALLALAGKTGRGPVWCWGLGILFFSGSLYVLSLDPAMWWAGPLTPLGGLFFIIGWGWFIINLLKKKE